MSFSIQKISRFLQLLSLFLFHSPAARFFSAICLSLRVVRMKTAGHHRTHTCVHIFSDFGRLLLIFTFFYSIFDVCARNIYDIWLNNKWKPNKRHRMEVTKSWQRLHWHWVPSSKSRCTPSSAAQHLIALVYWVQVNDVQTQRKHTMSKLTRRGARYQPDTHAHTHNRTRLMRVTVLARISALYAVEQ